MTQQNQIAEPRELLGLPQDYSYSEFKQAKYAFSRALHPDKNQNSEESKVLFQIFREITNILDPEVSPN